MKFKLIGAGDPLREPVPYEPGKPFELRGEQFMGPIDRTHDEMDVRNQTKIDLIAEAGRELLTHMNPGRPYDVFYEWRYTHHREPGAEKGQTMMIVVKVRPIEPK